MKTLLLKSISLVVLIFVSTSSFKPTDISFAERQKNKAFDVLVQLQNDVKQLRSLVIAQNWDEARNAYHRAKINYKSSEYLLEYYHHSSLNTFINGAPLPKIEENVTDVRIIKPQGFQRLEEILFEEEPSESDALWVLNQFEIQLSKLIQYHPRLASYDRHLIEATRYELIRIMALELTGFENPVNASLCIEQTKAAFSGIEPVILHYCGLISNEKQNQAGHLIKKGVAFFDADFDSFDRLAFIKSVGDPLFKLLLEVHQKSGIEMMHEVNASPIATNYEATSLFDQNIFNKSYFLKGNDQAFEEARIKLGKTLFFDPVLSKNNTLSCASCHHPDKAFTDGLPKSVSGDLNGVVDRNAPTLINALFAGDYFHDLRADRLEKQTEHVMVNPKEFNIMPLDLSEKLAQSDEYVALFQEAFGSRNEPIKPRTIQAALASYVASLTSWNSEFDQYVRGETNELSASAKNGFNLFMGKAACGTCHFAPNFNGIVPPFYDDTESEVLGITTNADSNNLELDTDLGRFTNGKRAEKADHFKHSIKTPTIRNAALTAPYFHNGGFNSLEDVMWFYNNGGGAGLGLDVPNQTLPPDHLNLNQQEIKDIIAFMNALSDVKSFQEIPDRLPDFAHDIQLQNRKPVNY